MQITTEIKGMFNYSIIPILFLLLILTILLIIIRKKKQVKIIPKEPPKKDKALIKEKYLKDINNLIKDVKENKINNRHAYQLLSKLIRDFTYEMTNIKVQYYTLSDIKKINMNILYDLVSEYYNPEFAKNSGANVLESINKTKAVIEKWN